jgi:single-strand DNA-binding protein
VNETILTVAGNVVADPKLRVTSTGTRVASFRLASTERRYDKALRGWRDGDTIFYSVSCWRNLGENVLESLSKGDPVVVHGRLRENRYEKEGQWHTVLEIEAYSLGHDISRGVSRFTRASVSAEPREVIVDDDVDDDLGAAGSDARLVTATGDGDEPVDGVSPTAA